MCFTNRGRFRKIIPDYWEGRGGIREGTASEVNIVRQNGRNCKLNNGFNHKDKNLKFVF